MDNIEFEQRKKKIFKKAKELNIDYSRVYTNIRKKFIITRFYNVRSCINSHDIKNNDIAINLLKTLIEDEFIKEIQNRLLTIELINHSRYKTKSIFLKLFTTQQLIKYNDIPKGAVKIHIYNIDKILKPRGTMEKESLGLYIKERLSDAYESWTDPEYGDNPGEELLLKTLKNNMMDEILHAWDSFVKKHNIKE